MNYQLNNNFVNIENDLFCLGNFVPFAEYDKGETKHITVRGLTDAKVCGRSSSFLGEGEKISVITDDGDVSFEAELFFSDRGMLFTGKVTNKSGERIMLRRAGLTNNGFGRLYSKKYRPTEVTVSTFHGDYTAGIDLSREFRRRLEESMLIYADGGRDGLLITPVNEAEANVFFDVSATWASLDIDLWSDMCCVAVDAGETRSIQDVAFIEGAYDDSVSLFADNLAEHLGFRDKFPVLNGWCSWYSVNMSVTEKHVLDVTEYFKENADHLKPDFIQIDEGYQVRRGDWECNPQFPNGWSEINRKIEETGAMPGIWICPIVVHRDSRIVAEHPEYISRLEGEAFPATDSGDECYDLDVTHPGVREFIDKTLKDKIADGFRYFKLDFNNAHTCGYTSYDPKMTSMQAYRMLFKQYRESLGEDNYLLGCVGGCKRGVIGYVDGARIGTDSCAHWEQFPLCLLNTLRMDPPRHFLSKLFTIDPDVTYLAPKWDSLTEDERKIWHSYVGISGGLVQFSEIREKIEKYGHQLDILFPPCPEISKTLYPVSDPDSTRIGFNAKRDFGDFGVYLMWNNKERASCENTLLSPALGEIGKEFHVFDFWNEEYLGVKYADFEIEGFEPRKAYLYRFTPVGAPVAIVGSTLHLSMGAAEIKDFKVGKDTVTIEFSDRISGGGAVYLYSEKELADAEFTGCSGEMTRNGNIVKLALTGAVSLGKITIKIKG